MSKAQNERIVFRGRAQVIPAKDTDNPDAYLVIGDDFETAPVIRIGSKDDMESLWRIAHGLNYWKDRV